MLTEWMKEYTPKAYEYRYLLFDIDGRTIGFGYNQRPAAIRNGESAGYGVWDCRTHTSVVPVNVEKRLKLLKEGRHAAMKKADEAFTRLHMCRTAVREGKIAG